VSTAPRKPRVSHNVVDSSAWLEYLAGSPRAGHFAAAIEDEDHLIVPVVCLYEVFKKLRRDVSEHDALRVAAQMQRGRVVEVDAELALHAATLNLPLADSLVYATAQRHQAVLWTQDADFEGLPAVRYFAKP
jgi:predicted nucleic acid-binding protein